MFFSFLNEFIEDIFVERPSPKHAARCEGRQLKSTPSNVMPPPVLGNIRQSDLMVVDLPMPLRPISASVSPLPIVNDTLYTACADP